jgi:uncharacterized membrane protein
MARLLTAWYWIESSLWFVPALMVFSGGALAILALTVDVSIAPAREVWWLNSGDASAASDLLEALLSSLITMATLAISITMVVLTLATNSLGPRLIESFVRDKRTQIPIGLFLGTIVYLVLILRTIDDGTSDQDVPHLAVTAGTALVLGCIATLLFFVHHLSRSIVADHMIARVGDGLEAGIAAFFPPAGDAESTPPPKLADGDIAQLRLRLGGYIQIIDHQRLVKAVRECGATVELFYRAGDHVLPGSVQGRVVPRSALDPVSAAVEAAVVAGRERTPVQDPEFAIRQLVEIALRALSPALNDPYTAVAVIHRLGLAFAQMLERGPAPQLWRDADGCVRLIVPAPTFAELVDTAFQNLRISGAEVPLVLTTLMQTLVRLVELARSESRREVLRRHINLVLATARRSLADPRDRAPIEELAAAQQPARPDREQPA